MINRINRIKHLIPPVDPDVTILGHPPGSRASAVTRIWPAGTGYCGRCPRQECNAHLDVCQVVVAEVLTMDEAEQLTTWHREYVDGPATSED